MVPPMSSIHCRLAAFSENSNGIGFRVIKTPHTASSRTGCRSSSGRYGSGRKTKITNREIRVSGFQREAHGNQGFPLASYGQSSRRIARGTVVLGRAVRGQQGHSARSLLAWTARSATSQISPSTADLPCPVALPCVSKHGTRHNSAPLQPNNH